MFQGGVANVIFAVKFMNFAFCNLGSETFCNQNLKIHLVALMICVPFSLIPKLRFFVLSAQIAGFFILTTIISIVAVSSVKISENGLKNLSNNYVNFSDLGEFFGVVCFSVEGFGLVLPIRSSLKKKKNFKNLFFIVCSSVILFYLIFGGISTLAFGKNLKSIVLFNFDHGYPVIYFQSLLYAIGIFISFPYVIFPLSPSLRKTDLLRKLLGVKYKYIHFIVIIFF